MANSSESLSEFDLEKWILFLERAVQPENGSIYAMFLTITVILCVGSLIGNSLVCFVICYDKSMHTTTNYYLLNLGISDLIMTFTMVLEAVVSFTHRNGFILCKIQWFLVVCLWNNSVLTMAALAIERYLVIWHPLMLKPTSAWRRVLKIIVLVWLMAIAETVLEMQTVGNVEVHNYSMCFIIPTPWARILNGVLAIVTFVIPLLIMIFAHSTIVYKVITTQMDNARDSIFNQQDPRGKISKLVIMLTASFVVCGLPFFLARVLLCALDVDQLLNLRVSWTAWFYIVIINSWVTVVTNPILYSLMSTKFRKTTKNLWNEKLRSSTSVEVTLQRTI